MTAAQIIFLIFFVFIVDRCMRRRALRPAKVRTARSDRYETHQKSRWTRFWDDADKAVNSMGCMDDMSDDFSVTSKKNEDMSRDELLEKLAIVEDRLDVLERIVTDKGYGLSEEINSLRD